MTREQSTLTCAGVLGRSRFGTIETAQKWDRSSLAGGPPPRQLEQVFVVGHETNHPMVSNAPPAGKAYNRRIEIVVYPESN